MDFDALANDLANSFGTSTGNNKPTDEHSSIASDLAKQFGSTDKHDEIKKPDRLVIKVTPSVPRSGFTQEQSDILNAQPTIQGTAQNAPQQEFPLSPSVIIPNVGRDIGQNFTQGLSSASEGLSDVVNRGELKQGAKKLGIGALQAVTAIPVGIAQGAVEEPVTQLTGNPDIGQRAGFVAGSALPIVPGAGALNKIRPSNVSLRDLVADITNEGANPENLVHVVQEMKSNPRLGPVDLNPAVQSAAQKLFTTDDAATKNYLASTSANRMASSADTVTGAYDTAAGIPVNAVQKLQDLANSAKKVGAEQINPAVKSAGPVNITNTLSSIDNILKPGVMSKISGESGLPLTAVKKELANIRVHLANKEEMRTGAEDLHKFQSGLRRTAESLLNSGDGGTRELGGALMKVRNNLVNDIDAASPQVNGKGTYKPALSNYRDEKDISEAFTNSYNGVLTNSKKMENLPEFTEQWVKSLTPEEKEAAKEGIRLRIRTEMGTARNPALAGQNMAKSDFNKQKMEMLLGKEETAKLLDTLEAERKIANTHNKIVENSQTAMRSAAQAKRDLPQPTKDKSVFERIAPYAAPVAAEAANFYGTGYAIPGLGLATTLGANLLSKGGTAAKDAIKMKLAREGNRQYAKMALPTQGPEREELIKSLEAAIPGPKQSLARRGANALSRLPVIPP